MSSTPSLLHHFNPLGSPMQPKKRKKFDLHFPKKSSHCGTNRTSLYPPWQHNSYIILPPQSNIVLAPIPEDCQCLSNSRQSNYMNNTVRIAPYQQITPSLLHHFIPSEQITTSLLYNFTPVGSPFLTPFYPLRKNYPLTITPIYAPWQPNYTSFYPFRINYPLTFTPFYPPWQPNYYIILPPLNKLPPYSYTILPPLGAQLLHHFIASEQITPSLLHHFTPLAAQLLPHFSPSDQITPSLLHHFTHCSPTNTPFYPLRTNYPLTLTPIYAPWQPNYNIILLPLIKLPPYSYTILPPLAAQLLHHFKPLWTNYPLTLTPLYPPWQTKNYTILPPLDKLPPHSYTILPPLAAQLLHYFIPSEQINPSLLHHFIPLAAQLLPHFTPSG